MANKLKLQKAIEAPSVIIAPHHQSAPKGDPDILRVQEEFFKRRQAATAMNQMPTGPIPEAGAFHRGANYESDNMDLPEATSPAMQAALDDLRGRDRIKSAEANIEEAHSQFERNYRASAAYRWEGQQRWMGKENEEMRKVNILHCDTFIHKLRRAGIKAGFNNPVVAEYLRDLKAIYPNRDDFEVIGSGGPRIWLNEDIAQIKMQRTDGTIRKVSSGRIGVNAWVKPEPGTKAYDLGVYQMKTLTTLQYPYSPEWSVMRFDEYDVPQGEKYRGWRTVLLVLITVGVLTVEEAHKAFGDPVGPASLFYREQLSKHRAFKLGIATQ